MEKPDPVEGLVIRYDYLWKNEAKEGQLEGRKDRPCVVIAALPQKEGGARYAVIAPITHSPPQKTSEAVELPAHVKKYLGLDAERSWIVTTEMNRLNWTDPGIRPAKRATGEYGQLPKTFMSHVQDRFRQRAKAHSLSIVRRERNDDRSR